MEAAILSFILIILALIIAIPMLFYHAWAFSLLWQWFMVPLGLPALSIAHAAGLILLYGVLALRVDKNTSHKKDKDEITTALSAYLLAPLVLVGIGYLLKGFL